MKKNYLFVLAALCLLTVSCGSGGNGMADDGILGKEGAQIAKSLDEYKTSYSEAVEYRKTHRRDTQEEFGKSVELDQKAEYAEKALEELVNELSESLIGRGIPVEVDDDVPMKMVEPLKVTGIKGSDGRVNLSLSGLVEMLSDVKVGEGYRKYLEDTNVLWVFADGNGQLFTHVNSYGEEHHETLSSSWMLADYDEKVNKGDRIKVDLSAYMSVETLGRKKIRLVQQSTLDEAQANDMEENDESL